MKFNLFKNKSHQWTIYSNPRNQLIQLTACAKCGIISSNASEASSCESITDRVSNMLERKGWVVYQEQNAA